MRQFQQLQTHYQQIITDKFVLLQQLGRGTFSKVYKAFRIQDGQIYAIKKVLLTGLKQKSLQYCLNQIRILASLQSSFIISFKQSIYDENQSALFIVMQFADNGDLKSMITQRKKHLAKFPQQEIWKAAGQILFALNDLHSLNIVHRDLKPANIFISQGVYKIGDLNVSKVMRQPMAVTQTGTPSYASPQIWQNQPYNKSVDIWSLGCVLYQMCSLKSPFHCSTKQSLQQGIMKGNYDKIPKKYSLQLQTFIQSMINPIANQRPSTQELLKNPFLPKRKNYYCTKLLNTIKIPRNLNRLKEQLPQNNYFNRQSSLPPIKKGKKKVINGDNAIYNSTKSQRKKINGKCKLSSKYLFKSQKYSIPQHKIKLRRINQI